MLVFILTRGPTFTEPGHKVDEKLHSSASRATTKEHGVSEWHTEDMEVFRPERWLAEHQDDELAFDPAADPTCLSAAVSRAASVASLRTLS